MYTLADITAKVCVEKIYLGSMIRETDTKEVIYFILTWNLGKLKLHCVTITPMLVG